jgi:hypothetical protein
LGDSLQWETAHNQALFQLDDLFIIPSDDPDNPLQLPRNFLLHDLFLPRLNQVFDYARRAEYPGIESDLTAVLNLLTGEEETALLRFYMSHPEFWEQIEKVGG